MRALIMGASALIIAFALAHTSVEAKAAQCRDAKGHFTKCPASAPATTAPTAADRCRDAKGHFAKCTTTTTSHITTSSSSTTMASTSGAKHCVKGKPCGKTCISLKDVCHIK